MHPALRLATPAWLRDSALKRLSLTDFVWRWHVNLESPCAFAAELAGAERLCAWRALAGCRQGMVPECWMPSRARRRWQRPPKRAL